MGKKTDSAPVLDSTDPVVAPAAPTLLDATALYSEYAFETPLPLPTRIDTANRPLLKLQMRETEQFLGLYDADGNQLMTTVWGYGTSASNTSYPGPTIVAYEDQPLRVFWQNHLPTDGHLLPVDMTLHMAHPMMRSLDDGFIPVVPHLHGGHTEPGSDGLPDAWFTQAGGKGGKGPAEVGPGYGGKIFTYANDQEAAPLWYHDHALGLTRLNVYAGLAGFYLLEDDQKQELRADGVLPDLDNSIELAIQDRAFTADGQLYYPAYRNDPLPGTEDTVGDMVGDTFYAVNGEDAPSAVPEFFGDVILVNGVAWPTHTVAAGETMLTLLNGSDSRFYLLRFDDPEVRVTLVGTDGGLLPTAIEIADGIAGNADDQNFIVLAPGDRVEVVVDFSGLTDGEVKLLNFGPAYEPFKGLEYADGTLAGGVESAEGEPVGAIMQFVVDSSLSSVDVSVAGGTTLNETYVDLTSITPDHVRMLGLFEGVDQYGRIQPLLGTAEAGELHTDAMTPDGAFGPLLFDAPITETPILGTTEQWNILNFTADAHPIHLHLVQYQVVQKAAIEFEDADENGIPDDLNGDGKITYGFESLGADETGLDGVFDIFVMDAPAHLIAIRPEDTGWQDTVWVGPNEMLTIVAEFDMAGEYVWHCHILSHEDNEMMRPFEVVADTLV